MTRYFYLLLFICVMAACSSGDSIPNNVLSPEKMQPVLFDVLRAQELANIKYGPDTTALNTNMPVMLQQVFEIHKITKDDFYNSFAYYEAHPDKNKELFDSLGAYTDRAKQSMYKAPFKTPR
jgi:hypothetical protein